MKAMYDGYTESEEKIESRKRRILGNVAPPEIHQVERISRWLKQPITTARGMKQVLLMMSILYPIAFLLGNLIGELIQALVR
jgi:antibiotic biosynthesis monooxygenase (ABM) superfamily enzyme